MANGIDEFLSALDQNPDDLEALTGLERTLSQMQDWTTLVDRLPVFAARVDDRTQRARFLIRSAWVARHRADAPDKADRLVEDVMASELEHDELIGAFQLAFAVDKDWDGLAQMLVDTVGMAPSDPARSRMLHLAGQTYENRLFDHESAIQTYQAAFKLDPYFTDPLRAARSIYGQADQWTTVERLYGIELKVTTDDRARARLLKELGHIQLERLEGRRDDAIATFREALSLDPDLASLQTIIDDLEGGSAATLDAVEVELEPVGADEVDGEPADPISGDALEPVDADEHDAGDEVVAIELTPVGADEDDAEEVELDAESLELEPVEATDDEEETAADAEADATVDVELEEVDADEDDTDAEDADDEAADEEVEVDADVENDVIAEDDGADDADELAADDATDDVELEDDEDVDASDDDASDDDASDDAAAEASDDAEEIEIEGADDADEIEVDDADDAEEIDVEDADGDDDASDEDADLDDADEAAASDDADSSDADVEASDDADDRDDADGDDEADDADDADESADADEAIAAEADGDDADDEAAAEADDDDAVDTSNAPEAPAAFTVSGDDAEAWLQHLVDTAEDASGAEAALAWGDAVAMAAQLERSAGELAEMTVDAVRAQDDGVEAVKGLICALFGRTDVWTLVADQLSPDDETDAGALYAVRAYALADIEGAASLADHAGIAGAIDAEIADVAGKGNWRKVFKGIEGELGDEVEAYRHQIFVALGYGNVPKALDSARRVTRKNKGDEGATAVLQVLYRAEENWNGLADLLKKKAKATSDRMDYGRVLLLRELVHIYREKVPTPNPMQIMGALQDLLEVDTRNVAVMNELGGMLRDANRWPDLVKVLQAKAEAVDDTAAEVAIYEEIAELCTSRFNNPNLAIEAWEAILEREPENVGALEQLEETYEMRRKWDELIDVKRRLVALDPDATSQADRLRSGAELAATRMRDNDLAVDLYLEVLAIAPGDAASLEALEQVYDRAKDWPALADVLAQRVEHLQDDDALAQALFKLGQIRADHLDELDGAVDAWEQLVIIEPENFRAREALKKAYITLERWDDLEAFFAQDEAWADYVRQIEALAGSQDDEATQLDLLFRAANVWVDRLDDVNRATKSLEKILSIDESNAEAASRLAPVYEDRGDYRRMPPVLEVILENELESEGRFELQARLARIHIEHLRDDEAGLNWFGEALTEQPHRIEVLDEIEQAAARSGEWEKVEQIYDDTRAALAGDPAHNDQWRDLSLRMGRLLEDHREDPDGALACFDDVLAREPDNLVALDARDHIFTRLERWDDLLDVVLAKVELAESDAERIALLERACVIREEYLDDVDAAIEGYMRILEVDADHLEALSALVRLHGRNGDAMSQTDVLRRLIELHPREEDPDRWAELKRDMARVLTTELGAHREAVAALEEVVSAEPSDLDARELLEQLLDVEEERYTVSRLLEPLYAEDLQLDRVVEMLEIQLSFETDVEKQEALLTRIGTLHAGKLEDYGSAFDAWSRLLRVNPRSERGRTTLEALAGRTDNWQAVVELYEELVDEVAYSGDDGPTVAVLYAERVARFFDVELSDPEEAIRMQRRVLEIEPGRATALDALDDLYTRTERWDDLLGVCEERLLHVEDVDEKRAIHFKAANLLEETLDDPHQAIQEFRRVLDLSAGDAEALESLDRLYGAVDDAASRAEIVERRAELAGARSAEQRELRNRLAALWRDELGDVHRSIELFAAVLGDDAHDETATAALEAMMRDDEVPLAAAKVLEPIYVEHGAHASLVELLEVRLTHDDDPTHRIDTFLRAATLRRDELGDAEAAWATFDRAVAESTGDERVLDGLYALAPRLERWDTLAERLEDLAGEADDPTVQRDTLVRVAKLRETKLDDRGAAAGLWRQVLDLDPYDREAIDALERLYGELDDASSLVEILLRKAELPDVLGDTALRKTLLFRAAALHEAPLEELDEAIEVMRQVLMIDPNDRDAIEHLERLFTRTSRWEDLVENYERKLQLATEDTERRELWFTLGAVLERELEEVDRAVDAYRAVLGVAPQDLDALRALDRLLAQSERWDELLDVLGQQAELVEDPEQARAVRFRMGQLQETELMNPWAALETWKGILAEAPDHAESRAALRSLIERGEEPAAAARVLEPIYRSEGAWGDLIAVQTTLVEATDDPAGRRDLHIDIARIHEGQLGDAPSAWASYAAAAREGARTSELDELERIARELARWEELAELYGQLLEDEVDPSMRNGIGLRLGRVYEEEIGEDPDAIDAFVRVIEENPDEQRALVALDRLYERQGAWESLADILQRRIMAEREPAASVPLRLRLAAVTVEALDDPAEAVNVYREILGIDPENTDAVDALESMVQGGTEVYEISMILDPLFRGRGAWDRVDALNRARIAHDDDVDERYRLWIDTADLREQQLNDAYGALDALGRALLQRPSDAMLRDRIEALAGTSDAWPQVAEIYQRVLGMEDLDEGDRLETATRLARVQGERLGDVLAAEQTWRIALEVEPASEPALRALDSILTDQQRYEELDGILGRLREVVFDPTEMTSLAARHARLRDEQLGHAGAAIGTWQEVLDLDPNHRPAFDALVRLYEQTGQHEELFDTWERLSMQVVEPAEQASIFETMARIAADPLDRADDAIDLWRRVLEVRGEDGGALENLAWLYRKTEQYAELADVIDRQVALASDDDARINLLQQVGYLHAEALDQPEVAIERYVKVTEIRPDEPTALEALRVLYERTANHDRFVEVVELMLTLGLIDVDEEAAVYERLGELYTDVLMRPEPAIRAWEARLERVPTDDNALDHLERLHEQSQQWPQCVAVIEKKVELAEDDLDKIELLKRIGQLQLDALQDKEAAAGAWERVLDLDLADFDAATTLERLYEELGTWDSMVGLHLDRLEVTEDSWERLELLRKAAGVYEDRLEQKDGAFLILAKAADEAPLDEEVLKELDRLGDETGKHGELANLYTGLISRVAESDEFDEEAALPLLMAVGRLQDEKLGRPELAEPYYDRALGLDPENEAALRALESIYERTDDPEMLVSVLKRRFNLTYDASEQVALYLRIGALYEQRLDDVGEATESYKMVLRIEDANAEVLAALERIYETNGLWRELIEVLGQRFDVTYEPPEQVALQSRIASIWSDQLDTPDRAIVAWREVLSIDPENIAAMEQLERLYAGSERWEKYLDVLDMRLSITQDPADRAELHRKQAQVHEHAFDDIDRAVDALNDILSMLPADLPAIEELERIFNEQERWPDLIDAYERHVAAVEDPAVKCAVLGNMATTWQESLDDVYNAIATWKRVLEVDAEHTLALEKLGLLYESIEDAASAIDAWERLAVATPTVSRRVEVLFRAGELREGAMNDLEGAEQKYRAAMAEDPDYMPALQALQRVFMTRQDWPNAIDMLQAQIQLTRDLQDRANLLVQVGAINEAHLKNETAAQRLYEEALDLHPSNVYAAEPLADMYFQQQRWERARSVIDLLVDSAEYEKDDNAWLALSVRLGRVNEELGLDAEASSAYERALELDPVNVQASLGLARLYRRAGRLAEAYELFRDVLSAHRTSLDVKVAVDLYSEAGAIKRELDEPGAAREMYERALEIEPKHEPSLRSLVEVLEAADADTASLVEARQRLLDVTEDDSRRLTLLIDIGDGLRELGDTVGAEAAYRGAVSLNPESKVILHKLLDTFTDASNWKRATEVLGQLTRLETDPARKAQYFFAIGAIFRDEMGNLDNALEHFNNALDANPSHLAPFEAIDKLLTERKDWKNLERAYRRMIERVAQSDDPAHAELRFVLAKNLGEIYRSRVGDFEKAISAYQYAISLRPEDEALYVILADLYVRAGAGGAQVIKTHQKLIEISPFRVESYQALFKAYLDARQVDRAWCMAAALSVLQKADEKQKGFYERGLPNHVQQTRRALGNEHWQKLYHGELDLWINHIFAPIAVHLREDFARSLRDWSVKRRDRINLDEETPLATLLKYVSERVGVALPVAYEKPEVSGLVNGNVDPPALMVGADMRSGRSQKELAFVCGRSLALMRPEFYLASAFIDTAWLKVFFRAALAITQGSIVGEDNLEAVQQMVGFMQRLPEPVQVQIRRAVENLLNSGVNPDMSAWLRNVDHTASRVGLLLCGDLRQAISCIKNEAQPLGKSDVKEKVRQLIVFAISDEYFELREELGLALQAK